MLLSPSARVSTILVLLSGVSFGLIFAQINRVGSAYISGTWSDACPCKIPCPCWSNHESSAQVCTNFHVFRIETGSYHGVDLSGSVFVLLNLPKGVRQRPIANTLFVNADDPRRAETIERGFRDLFAFAAPKVLRAPIHYSQSGRRQTVLIPGLLSYNLSFEREQRLSPDVSLNLYHWLSNARQGFVQSVLYYPERDERVEYSNTNAISAQFRVPVPPQ